MKNLMIIFCGILLSSSLWAQTSCNLALSKDSDLLIQVDHELTGADSSSFWQRAVNYELEESYTISGYTIENSEDPYLAVTVKRIHNGTIHQKLVPLTKININELIDYQIENAGYVLTINCEESL